MRNENGAKGKICNNCGGYGKTIVANGGGGFCWFCRGTGIEFPDVWKMKKDIEALFKALELPAVAQYGEGEVPTPTKAQPALPWYARLIRKLAHLQ